MKLLLDANLSFRLLPGICKQFPDSSHVNGIKLSNRSDIAIWEYAKLNGYCILTKDADFNQLSFLNGAPPKIIWLRCGNASTMDISLLWDKNLLKIRSFLGQRENAILVVG